MPSHLVACSRIWNLAAWVLALLAILLSPFCSVGILAILAILLGWVLWFSIVYGFFRAEGPLKAHWGRLPTAIFFPHRFPAMAGVVAVLLFLLHTIIKWVASSVIDALYAYASPPPPLRDVASSTTDLARPAASRSPHAGCGHRLDDCLLPTAFAACCWACGSLRELLAERHALQAVVGSESRSVVPIHTEL